MFFVLVVFLHRRLGHVLLDGLVRLPGLMSTNTSVVTVGVLGVKQTEDRSKGLGWQESYWNSRGC